MRPRISPDRDVVTTPERREIRDAVGIGTATVC